MPTDDARSSVSEWIEQLRRGEVDASRKLWQHYHEKMIRLARSQLRSLRRRGIVDEDDVAAVAFEAFDRAMKAGRYPTVNDRDDLWRVLFRIVKNRAIDEQRRERRLKDGGGKVRGDSVLRKPGETSSQIDGFGTLPIREPTPDEAVTAAEQYRHLMSLLPDPILRQTAEQKFEGYTNEEIALQQNCSLSSVERRLGHIRKIWKEAGAA